MSQQTLSSDRDPRQLQQALWRWDNEGGAGPAAPRGSPTIQHYTDTSKGESLEAVRQQAAEYPILTLVVGVGIG